MVWKSLVWGEGGPLWTTKDSFLPPAPWLMTSGQHQTSLSFCSLICIGKQLNPQKKPWTRFTLKKKKSHIEGD